MFFREDLNLGNKKSVSTLPHLPCPHIKYESSLAGMLFPKGHSFCLLASRTTFICFCFILYSNLLE